MSGPLRRRAARAVARFDSAVERRVDRVRGNPHLDRVMYAASALGDFSLIWHLVSATRALAPDRRPEHAVRVAAVLAVPAAAQAHGLGKWLDGARQIPGPPPGGAEVVVRVEVCRVLGHGPLEQRQGFLGLAAPSECKAQPVQRGGVAGEPCNGFAVVGDGVRQEALLFGNGPEQQMRVTRGCLDSGQGLQLRTCGRGLAGSRQRTRARESIV